MSEDDSSSEKSYNYEYSEKTSKLPFDDMKIADDNDDDKYEKITNSLTSLKSSNSKKKCLEHSKEASLYCETHHLKNLCATCFHNNHLNCDVTTMESLTEKDEILHKIIEREENEKINVLKEINKKEKHFLSKISATFEKIRSEVKEIFDKHEEEIKENIAISSTGARKNLSYENQKHKKISIDISEVQITYEINEKNSKTVDEDKDLSDSLKKFVDTAKSFDLPLEIALKHEIKKFKEEYTSNPNNTNPYVFMVLKDHKTFLLRNRKLTIEDAKNLGKLLIELWKIESFNIFNNDAIGDGFIDICQGLIHSAKSLKEIKISQCNLNGNHFKILKKLLLSCPLIEKVDLSYNKHVGAGLQKMYDGLLNTAASLKELDLSYCSINKDESFNVGQLLESCFSIQKFKLRGNFNIGAGFLDICDGLIRSSASLREIDLSECQIGEGQSKVIGQLLEMCTLIENISLSGNRNMKNGIIDICNALHKSTDSLKFINFASCNINEKQCKSVGELLSYCSNIEKVDFSYNEQIDNGLSYLCDGLIESSNTLTDINFSNCDLNDYKIKFLGKLLRYCIIIEKIDISNNFDIRNNFNEICIGLRKSCNNLKIIDFSSCKLHKKFSPMLNNLFSLCPSIEKINLSGNQHLGQGFTSICTGLLSSAHSLREVNFSSVNLDKQKSLEVAQLFKNCNLLEAIDLSTNENMTTGLQEILNALIKTSSSIKKINLSNCDLNKRQCQEFGEFLKNCQAIEEINLSLNENMKSGLKDICTGLAKSTDTLNKLDFYWCDLRKNECESIGILLENCSNIRSIYLDVNCNMNEGFGFICNGLKRSANSLRELNLDQCDLSAQQSEYLQSLLQDCKMIEDINLSCNPKIENGFLGIFKELQNSENILKKIDLSYCSLEVNYGTEYAALLLNCTLIEDIDLSGNPNMGNGLSDVCKSLISSSGNLKIIKLASCKLNKTQCQDLGELLLNCPLIEEIDLSLNEFINSGIQAICIGLQRSSNRLKVIKLCGCDLNKYQCKDIAELLRNCSSLETFDLSSNERLVDGLLEIFDGLHQSCHTLKSINFSSCELDKQCGKFFSSLLSACIQLQDVYLSGNVNIRGGLSDISAGLSKSCNTLEQFTLSNCDLRDNHCQIVAQTLKNCIMMEKIDFSMNMGLKKDGIPIILESLSKSAHRLKKINISSCNLSEIQGKNIGKGSLSRFTAIESINLSNNDNMRYGLAYICKGLTNSAATLNEVDFSSCNLKENLCREMGKLFQICLGITVVDLSNNKDMKTGINHISEGLLNSNSALKELHFNKNTINKIEMKLFGKLLLNSTKLEFISLRGCSINSTDFVNVSKQLIKKSPNLKTLDLYGCELEGIKQLNNRKILI